MSDVEVSVSTESELNVRSTTRPNMRSSSAAGSSASVNTKANIVAMSGSIMPTPLATPTIRQSPTCASAILGTVSVVIIASATAPASVTGKRSARPAWLVRSSR